MKAGSPQRLAGFVGTPFAGRTTSLSQVTTHLLLLAHFSRLEELDPLRTKPEPCPSHFPSQAASENLASKSQLPLSRRVQM